MKEYNIGIKHENSALSNFAEKYDIDGKPGLTPLQFFKEKFSQLKHFLRNHRNIKVRMLLICEMERKVIVKSKGKSKVHFIQDIAYFQSETNINFEKSDVKVILSQMIMEIMENLDIYLKNGSGWYFKKVIRFEIHTIGYKPIKGSSFISLPVFIKRKNAIINIKKEDNKCFLWCVLRYLHPTQCHEERVADLREYENDVNFERINFPVKVKDIQKFENQNPDLPGINVFSINDNNQNISIKT